MDLQFDESSVNELKQTIACSGEGEKKKDGFVIEGGGEMHTAQDTQARPPTCGALRCSSEAKPCYVMSGTALPLLPRSFFLAAMLAYAINHL